MEFIRFLRFVQFLIVIFRSPYENILEMRSYINKITSINMFFLFLTEIHKFCFIIFIATSECYMLISYILNRHSPKMLEIISTVERKSLQFKRTLFYVNILSFWFAGYFFLRHNSYCEPGGNFAKVQKILTPLISIIFSLNTVSSQQFTHCLL